MKSLESDIYRTVVRPSPEVIFKDRGSKFLGYVFPLQSEEEVKEYVNRLKKAHHKARHWCYAWRLGVENVQFRVNDDGEPNNSAGQPIYGQILSKGVTNVLIVVVRYFGGTKLGVGGLVNAYKMTSLLALEASKIVKKAVMIPIKLIFEYSEMNNVMRIIKEYDLFIKHQKMELDCEFELEVRKNDIEKVRLAFHELRKINLFAIES